MIFGQDTSVLSIKIKEGEEFDQILGWQIDSDVPLVEGTAPEGKKFKWIVEIFFDVTRNKNDVKLKRS